MTNSLKFKYSYDRLSLHNAVRNAENEATISDLKRLFPYIFTKVLNIKNSRMKFSSNIVHSAIMPHKVSRNINCLRISKDGMSKYWCPQVSMSLQLPHLLQSYVELLLLHISRSTSDKNIKKVSSGSCFMIAQTDGNYLESNRICQGICF